MWNRYANDIFNDAKQSSPDDRFTEETRAALVEWADGEGRQELRTTKDTYEALRRKLAELARIPLRDSSGRKKKPKTRENMIMSSSPDRSPFEDLAHPAIVPSEMQARVTVRDVNTAEPGPFYVYIPGIDAEGLKDMLHSNAYATIPAGEVFRIGAIEESMLAGRLDMAVPHREIVVQDALGQKKPDTLHVIAIPASTTLKAIQSDFNIQRHVLAHLSAFDKVEIEHKALNNLIRPLVKQKDGSMGTIQELSKPGEWRKEIEAVGMLALRLRWLQEAAEKLETGRMLEETRRYIDRIPHLRDTWHKAITDYMIPAIDQFRNVAEAALGAIEERMKSPATTGDGAKYDRYSFKMMWLLGRRPEREALTRTLTDAGKGGLSPDEIKIFIANEMARQSGGNGQVAQTVTERMQCSDCGEFVNMVNGGPPRKCRHCGFEFRPQDVPLGERAERAREFFDQAFTPQGRVASTVLPEESAGTKAAAELDEAAPLAAQGEETVAQPVGSGLSPEDEAEIDDLAASILRG